MTDARAEDQERIVGQPVKATRVGRCAVPPPACKDKILIDDDIVEVGGNWVHESCVDEMEARLAEPDSSTVELTTAFGGTERIDRVLLDERTQEQIDAGRLANDKLDPRGYVVTCHGCCMQWWATPDNLPIRKSAKHYDWCTAVEQDRGRAT